MKIVKVKRSSVSALRKLVFPTVALLLLVNLASPVFAALPMQKGTNAGGTGRGDEGQVLRVTVTLNGKPVGGAIVKVKVGDGSVVLSGVTLKNGILSRNLDAGVYTVTATSGKNSATAPITIVQSNDPLMVPLALTPTAP